MDDQLVADHLDALHAAPREDFVTERDARVRQLRASGHAEEARAVGAVRKPTVAAWAVNQLARRETAQIAELVEAGDGLRAAQRRAASGQGADGLRPATRRVRDLVGALADPARAILAEAGAGAGHTDEVEQTLFAAAVDPDLHDTLRRGVFTRTVEAAGFGTLAGLTALPTSPAGDDGATTAAGAGEATTAAVDADDQERRRVEEDRARRASQRRALETQRADLRRSLVRQQRNVDRAREQAEVLRTRADEAAATAASRQADLDAIAAEIDTVEAELDTLTDEDG